MQVNWAYFWFLWGIEVNIQKIATARNRAWVLRATIWGTNHYTTVATLSTQNQK